MSNKKLIPELRFPEFKNEGEWEVKTLGEIAEIKRGAASQHLNYVDDKSKGIRLLRINDFLSDAPVYVKDSDDMKRFRVKTNDLLIAGTGATAGITFIVPKECNDLAYSYNAPRIRLSNDDNFFIYNYLKSESILNQQKKLFVGNAQPFLYTDAIRSFKISIPKLDEQQKIASCLSSLDEVIAAHNQKLDLLKDHKKGLMQNLFPDPSASSGGEMVPKYRFKEFENDGEWVEKKLGEVATFINDKTPITSLSVHTYISTENLLAEYAGVVSASKLPASGNFTKYQEEDILISNIRPYLKKVWFSNKIGSCSNDVFVVRAKSEISKIFLSFWLRNDDFINFVMIGAKGVKMPRGDKDLISKYPILFPKDKAEQQKIASCLSSLDALISAQAEKIEQLKLHKKGLMQGLFPKVIE